MNTTKHSPDSNAQRGDAAVTASAAMRNADLPQLDLDTPLYQEEATKADLTRREAASAAFRNEKAHERPPRHQA